MGCDIHAYVEFSKDGKYWDNLTDNAGRRDYRMFGIMAGVRWEKDQLFEPKGMPEGPLSYTTETSYWKSVAPDNHPEWADSEGYVSRKNAERWVSSGYSKPDIRDGVLKRVTDPDSHTHSWLSCAEVEECVSKYRQIESAGEPPIEWVGILAAMKAIEANGYMTRVVFWFDN